MLEPKTTIDKIGMENGFEVKTSEDVYLFYGK